MAFSQGNYIAYNFENVNHTRPIATAKLVIGFKTVQLDVGLAQITGILVLKNIVLSFLILFNLFVIAASIYLDYPPSLSLILLLLTPYFLW